MNYYKFQKKLKTNLFEKINICLFHQTMNIFFILLGCNIGKILFDRLETSIKFIQSNIYSNSSIQTNSLMQTNSSIHITWFLSGGIKNNFEGAISEASVMKYQIDNIINLKYINTTKNNLFDRIGWDFIMDEKSTNTAENFIRASKFLNTTTKSFDSIYVITSYYHYPRANQMLKLIDPSRNFKWILGDLEEEDSRYWETIHIKNVMNDVYKAKNILSF